MLRFGNLALERESEREREREPYYKRRPQLQDKSPMTLLAKFN